MPLTRPLSNTSEIQCDSTLVKGESLLSRQSSADSVSPDIDISSLLTHINAPQITDSSEALEQRISSPHVVPESVSPRLEPTSIVSSRARMRHLSGSTMEERLVMIPEKRALPWREGIEPGAENETGGESRRKQIRFGCLLATRGEVQSVPCNSCANGRGKFSVCVGLPNFFKGACASCQLSGRPNRCSIKKTDDPSESPNISRTLSTSGVEETSNSTLQQAETEGPRTKRRKTTVATSTQTAPEWENTQISWEKEIKCDASHQLNTVQRNWVTVNSQTTTQAAQGVIKEITPSDPVPQATLNQANSLSLSSSNRPSSDSVYIEHEKNSVTFQLDRSTREGTAPREEGDALVLIDSLPRGKQRQVYGLISGIQGGIDHLQRELSSLKRALGIDDNEN